jgi:uncharacterized protein YjeT (DUF2065 family)
VDVFFGVLSAIVVVEALVFIVAPAAVIRYRKRRTGEDFGKGPYPSAFERIFGTENHWHIRIFGIVLLTMSVQMFILVDPWRR